MKFAVIQTGGKQYRVSEGDVITVEKLGGEMKEGDKVVFDTVLMADDGKSVSIGAPNLASKVEAEYVAATKGEKIRIQKFKSKSNYDKVTGHRQKYDQVKIVSIA